MYMKYLNSKNRKIKRKNVFIKSDAPTENLMLR